MIFSIAANRLNAYIITAKLCFNCLSVLTGCFTVTPSVQQIEEDPTGGKLAALMGKLGGAPHKLDNSIQFHVGDTITALARATLQPGGSEVLLYGTIMGGIGAFFPFQAKEVSG
jgi:hypothetical protein